MGLNDVKGKVWEGVYRSFDQIPIQQDVFEGAIWREKINQRAEKLLLDSKPNGAIPYAALTRDYILPVVVALIAAEKKPIRILDFGGGLGTSFIPLKAMLPASSEVSFTVVENDSVCADGENLFQKDPSIRFTTNIPKNEKFDIVHLGSSIHYVDAWKELLKSLTSICGKYLIIADLPAGKNRTFVTAQSFYGNKIPVRFWNLKEFTDEIERHGFGLVFQSNYVGYYASPDEPLPTEHFDADHRLNQFCQLMFVRS